MRCQLPLLRSTFAIPVESFGAGLPCEQPPPPTSAYRSPSKNTTSATPMVPLTPRGPMVSEGKAEVAVVTFPLGLILEIRAVSPPVSGPGPPGGPGTCGHCPMVLFLPPVPASATYRLPSGPNLRPRGPSRPLARVNGVGSIADCAIDGMGAKLATAEVMTREDNDPMIFIPWSPFLVLRQRVVPRRPLNHTCLASPADICSHYGSAEIRSP